MLYYNDLRADDDSSKRSYELLFPEMTKDEKIRANTKLLELKRGLDSSVAAKRADENLIVASWNIKEFGHTTQRLPESYFYIAEILSYFDLIAVQEIKSNLDDLFIIMRLLGDDWGYLVNDITEGSNGNSERSCYIFNKKRVDLSGLAGEIVLWDDLTENSTIKQLKRTPFMTGFNAGWESFAMINLHLHPGDGANNIAIRKEEVSLLLQALAEKIDNDRLWSNNLILVGDFNLYSGATKDDPTIKMINDAGYREIESLLGLDTNASETDAYDRFFLTRNENFSLAQNDDGGEKAGVFNPFDYVFKPGEEQIYKDYMKGHYGGEKDLDIDENLNFYYRVTWRKNQMTDHLPIWFELITDFSPLFLERNLQALTS